jgi:hypothetical protein
MYFFDLAHVIIIFRTFRRDDTPEMANLKTDAAYTPESTPDDLAGSKCLKFKFRHDITSAPETP